MALGPLIDIQHEFVRVRHPAIQDYLQGLQIHGTTTLLKLRDAQADLAMRLLAYCKFNLNKHQEPSMEVVGETHIHKLFTNHCYSNMQYAIVSTISMLRPCTSTGPFSSHPDSKVSSPVRGLWQCWNGPAGPLKPRAVTIMILLSGCESQSSPKSMSACSKA